MPFSGITSWLILNDPSFVVGKQNTMTTIVMPYLGILASFVFFWWMLLLVLDIYFGKTTYYSNNGNLIAEKKIAGIPVRTRKWELKKIDDFLFQKRLFNRSPHSKITYPYFPSYEIAVLTGGRAITLISSDNEAVISTLHRGLLELHKRGIRAEAEVPI
ncbi:MAG: hypothetical protein LBV28_02290 [Puniceicoccales bacterium]|jgi:hypothetical protein|nr:hypothetical protein [Puniceicoccales bacterium]